ncbi:MAG: hypothetical protein K2X54_16110 [Methylobacterium organophilum]|nr:hypothetical protein [Methylobacterium organophilum]
MMNPDLKRLAEAAEGALESHGFAGDLPSRTAAAEAAAQVVVAELRTIIGQGLTPPLIEVLRSASGAPYLGTETKAVLDYLLDRPRED